jgi:hypothetical protein
MSIFSCFAAASLAAAADPDVLAETKRLIESPKYKVMKYGAQSNDKAKINCTEFVTAVLKSVLQTHFKHSLTTAEIRAINIDALHNPGPAKKLLAKTALQGGPLSGNEKAACQKIIDGKPLTLTERTLILNRMVLEELSETKGVVSVLTSLAPQPGARTVAAKAIEPENAQPGDIIQYWQKTSSGNWTGHTAVIQSVFRQKDAPKQLRASLLGSHPRTVGKPSGGPGLMANSSGKPTYIGLTDRLGKKRDAKNWKIYVVRLGGPQ